MSNGGSTVHDSLDSEIESATPLGVFPDSQPLKPDCGVIQPVEGAEATGNARRITFSETPPSNPSSAILAVQQQQPLPRGKKTVTFGPTTIIWIPPRTALLSDSQETIDSPSLPDDDLLPFLSVDEKPACAMFDHDQVDEIASQPGETLQGTSLLASRTPITTTGLLDTPAPVTLLKRAEVAVPPKGQQIAEEVDVDEAPSPGAEANTRPIEQAKHPKQQRSLSSFGFSATVASAPTSATEKTAGQKRPRDRTQKKKGKPAHGKSRDSVKQSSQDSDSSEYEIDEPLSSEELGKTPTPSGDGVSSGGSFSQFEIIGLKRVVPQPATDVNIPSAAWTDEASQEHAPSPSAQKSFWDRVRGLTSSTANEGARPALDTATAKDISERPRDTSPILFVEKEKPDLELTPSSGLSKLANAVDEAPCVAEQEALPKEPQVASSAQGRSGVGYALVCDLCGLAELPGCEGMILAPVGPAHEPPSYNAPLISGFYAVHLQCALWSPEVYFEDNNNEVSGGHYCGVGAAVTRARHIKCAHCRRVGASIGCLKATCQRSYHRACAEEAGAFLDGEEFQLACPNHKNLLCSKKEEAR